MSEWKLVAYVRPVEEEITDERVPVIGWRYKSDTYTVPLYRNIESAATQQPPADIVLPPFPNTVWDYGSKLDFENAKASHEAFARAAVLMDRERRG